MASLQLTLLIKDKSTLNEDKMGAIKEIVGEEDKAREIVEVRAGDGPVSSCRSRRQQWGGSSGGQAPAVLLLSRAGGPAGAAHC